MSSAALDDGVSIYSSAYSVASTATGTAKPRKRKPRVKPGTATKPTLPQKPAFSHELVQKGLSQLGKTADGLRSAYLRLDISGTDLATTDGVVGHKDLQALVLPGNELSDLSSLQQLPNLTSLDVSNNKLTQVLGFSVPDSGSNLRVADLSSNLIQLVPDLSRFSRLAKLNLDRNQLESMTGLGFLPMLSSLSLVGNKLTTLHGLHQLSGLRHLCVEDNQLRSLAPVGSLTSLEVLQAARNNITSLSALGGLVRLQQLDVSDNQLHSLHVLAPCTEAALLCELKVRGNPLCLGMSCRLHLVYLLPQVAVLDGQPVSPNEKVLSANMHGADAEDLRRIRRRYFPDGELDDGGGALPPPSAGLVASCAEEEITDSTEVAAAFIRIDAWARSVPVPQSPSTVAAVDEPEAPPGEPQEEVRISSPRQAGAALIALAQHLSSTCSGQLQLARVCLEWVASHITPPSASDGGATSVHAPLFTPPPPLDPETTTLDGGVQGWGGGPAPRPAERLLIRGQKGTWSERAATLFSLLAKACELEAVIIPGYCKALGVGPGKTLAAHNHCWAGVKVGGRWRLVDPSLAAIKGGSSATPAAPFFIPPQAWIYSYFPLEAHWQLLSEPITLESWWGLPHLSVGFFARGLKLISPDTLGAVNVLPAPKEGGVMPCLEVCVAAPVTPTTRLRHVVRSAATGAVVAGWAEPQRGGGTQQTSLAYQQVDQGESGATMVQFGANTFASRTHRLVTSMPSSGEYLLEVMHVTDLPGGMAVHVDGLPSPLMLRLEESEVVLQARLTVPDIEPHDPDDGLLHSPDVVVCPQPTLHPQFVHLGAQLLAPHVGTWLEADRTYTFQILAPDGSHLLVTADGGFSVPLRPAHQEQYQEGEQEDAFACAPLAQGAMAGSRPASNIGNTPASATNRPTSATKRPPSATNRPPSATERPPSATERPPSATERPPSATERPTSATERATERPPSATERPPSATERPTTPTAQPTSAPDQPSASTRPTSATNRPASATNRPGSASHTNSNGFSSKPSVAMRPASASNRLVLYEGHVTAPRATNLHIKAYTRMVDLGVCGWLPLLTFPIAPQSQHIVDSYIEPDIPHVELDDPVASQVNELFGILDKNKDGKVTRAEMLCALRRHPQVGDSLHISTAVHAHDGTLDTFVDRFLAIDSGKLGAFSFSELCMHMGVKPSVMSEEEDEYTEGEEGEYEGEGGDYEGDSRPTSPGAQEQ